MRASFTSTALSTVVLLLMILLLSSLSQDFTVHNIFGIEFMISQHIFQVIKLIMVGVDKHSIWVSTSG
jgi:hypothetical protein